MTEDIFVCFKQEYSLSPQIPFTELSTNIPKFDAITIEFITDKNYVTGFVVVLEKELELTKGENGIDHFSKFLTHYICFKSNKLTRCSPSTSKYIMKNGKVITGYNSTHIYRVEGAPAKLNIKGLLKISKSSHPHIKQYIGYLAKTIIFHQKGFPDHSIIEAFKIIEPDKNFIHYRMYYALRNILAHSPYYRDPTMPYFKEPFNKDDFDYIKYKPESNLIVLDLDSNKTQRKLNEIVVELLNHLKIYLNLE
jgi:hypothetical protein